MQNIRWAGNQLILLLLVFTAGLSVSGQAAAEHHDGTSGVSSLDVYQSADRTHLLYTEGQPQSQADVFYRWTENGKDWSEPIKVNKDLPAPASPHRGMDIQLAAVGSKVLAAWTIKGTDPWGGGPICTALSNDGGHTWKSGGNPADDGSTEGHNFIDIAADKSGTFHMVWLDKRAGSRGLRYAQSVDGGLTWSKNIALDPATCECCWNTILSAGQAGLTVLFRQKVPRDMAVVKSDDGGKTWSKPAPLANFNWKVNGCPHVGGGLVFQPDSKQYFASAWNGQEGASQGAYVFRSSDSGTTWVKSQQLGDQYAWHNDIAGGPDRQVAAVWDTTDRKGILASITTDGGNSWSEPQQLSSQNQAVSHPRIIFANGHFQVFWTEKQPDNTTRWVSKPL